MCIGKCRLSFSLLHMGHWLFMVARAMCHASCPNLLICADLSSSNADPLRLGLGFVGQEWWVRPLFPVFPCPFLLRRTYVYV